MIIKAVVEGNSLHSLQAMYYTFKTTHSREAENLKCLFGCAHISAVGVHVQGGFLVSVSTMGKFKIIVCLGNENRIDFSFRAAKKKGVCC